MSTRKVKGVKGQLSLEEVLRQKEGKKPKDSINTAVSMSCTPTHTEASKK